MPDPALLHAKKVFVFSASPRIVRKIWTASERFPGALLRSVRIDQLFAVKDDWGMLRSG